jgi:hypothetical protein
MRKRWAFWLVLLHVAVTSVFVVREEVAEWDSPPRWRDWVQAEPIPRWMTVLNAWVHGTRAPNPQPLDDLLMSVDFWTSTARKGYYVVEFPVALLVGWYQHPLSALGNPPLFPPALLPGLHYLRPRTRAVVLEALMVAIVALHWWAVAWVLRRQKRFARWVKLPVIGVTVGGVVCAVACLAPRDWMVSGLLALVALGVAMIGWIWVFSASAAYVVWSAYLWVYHRVHAWPMSLIG